MTRIFPEALSQEMHLILEALNNIHERYYFEDKTSLKDESIINNGGTRYNESTFVTQLVGRIQNKFEEASIHIDKFYQTDAPKHIVLNSNSFDSQSMNNTLKDLLFKDHEGFYKIPDIVIHAGPNDKDPINQIFIAEVKTSFMLPQHKFDADLFKVNVYHKELDFQNSAFIIINSEVCRVQTLLEAYKSNNYYQTNKEGLYIIVKPTPTSNAVVYNQF